jgi:hypothetical protein
MKPDLKDKILDATPLVVFLIMGILYFFLLG